MVYGDKIRKLNCLKCIPVVLGPASKAVSVVLSFFQAPLSCGRAGRELGRHTIH